MSIGPIAATALSGFQAGLARVAHSAHNIANLATEGAPRLRTEQAARAGGGVDVDILVADERIDLAVEAVEQIRGRTQAEASLRTLAVDRRLHEGLLDIHA